MDLDLIKKLMLAMNEHGIKKLSLKEGSDLEISLELKEESGELREKHHLIPSHKPHIEPPIATSHPVPEGKKHDGGKEKFITSPMVGTFYSSPSPEDPPFVRVGDRVEENTLVCIIEAMKVMNEVKAGKSGVIREVLVENAHPVEFGTQLFQID